MGRKLIQLLEVPTLMKIVPILNLFFSILYLFENYFIPIFDSQFILF